MYERSLRSDAVAAAAIRVERINGPVLLVAGEADQVWSAKRVRPGARGVAGRAGLLTQMRIGRAQVTGSR
ncbi:acyl-CoA thioester hydrolase/BAAT C-terminal domain-containing protein [Nonomuraea sp. NPDC049158]|uniref:acyl-CoA thioester hydrolase/BAAT C-terminal domain-containing protein n=1 Tax=Nonomuraea sp. NPDC049158 TaxID=3155649 RepID=UPI0033C1FA19